MTDPRRARRARPPRHRNDGWVPQQHGAWAMLVVPLLAGAIWRFRDGGTGWRDVALVLPTPAPQA